MCQLFGDEIADIPRRTYGESHYVANRGFVCEVRCTATDWLTHGDSICKAHPVRKVKFTTDPDPFDVFEFHRRWPGIEFEMPTVSQAEWDAVTAGILAQHFAE